MVACEGETALTRRLKEGKNERVRSDRKTELLTGTSKMVKILLAFVFLKDLKLSGRHIVRRRKLDREASPFLPGITEQSAHVGAK